MTKTKAQKHLSWAKEHLQYLRESYVEIMRDPNWRRRAVKGSPFSCSKRKDDLL